MEQQAGRSTTVARAAKATPTAEEQHADAKVTCTPQQAVEDALAQLEQERAAWDAHEPRHYRFQTEEGGESDPYLSVQTMEVKDGMRIALYRAQPDLVDLVPVSCVSDTVDTLFGCVQAEFARLGYRRGCGCDCKWEWEITYDPKYHYVASFHVYDWEWTDSDWGFGVTQFTVLD